MKLLLQITAEVVGGLIVAAIIGLATWAWAARKAYKQLQDDMYALKTNHLPHIYYVLGLICKHLGIDFEGGNTL